MGEKKNRRLTRVLCPVFFLCLNPTFSHENISYKGLTSVRLDDQEFKEFKEFDTMICTYFKLHAIYSDNHVH